MSATRLERRLDTDVDIKVAVLLVGSRVNLLQGVVNEDMDLVDATIVRPVDNGHLMSEARNDMYSTITSFGRISKLHLRSPQGRWFDINLCRP